MEETYTTRAIILNKQPFKENDSRIIVFSLERGKLDLVVRGTSKTLSKLSGHIEPANLADLMVAKGRQYEYACSALNQASFKSIKGDLEKLQSLGIVFRTFNKIIKPGIADPRLFFLLESYLRTLDSCRRPEKYELLAYFFIYKMLAELGYRPELERCVACGKKISPDNNRISLESGGLVCSSCHSKNIKKLLTIHNETIKMLKLAKKETFASLLKIKLSPVQTKELISIISSFYHYQFE